MNTPAHMSDRISQSFLWLGGVDPTEVQGSPRKRMRMAATGGTVLTTGLLAAAAATITVHTFLYAAWALALMAGLAWGAAIITLDRWMLLSICRQPQRWMTLLLAAPRVALAVASGYVLSKPVELIAFNAPVVLHAQADKKQEEFRNLSAIGAYYAPQIKELSTQQTSLETKLAKLGDDSFLKDDPVYESDISEAQRLQNEAQDAETEAICELSGTCGTRHVGAGPVYAAKAARAADLKTQAAAAERAAQHQAAQLTAEQQGVVHRDEAAEQGTLQQISSRLDSLRHQQTKSDAAVEAGFKAPIGLPDRLTALGQVESSSFETWLWTTGLTLVLLLVDAGPVLGKVLLLLGPEAQDEVEQALRDETATNVVRVHCEAEVEAARIFALELVDEATLHRQQWNEVYLEPLTQRVLKIQGDIVEEEIHKWERLAREEVGRARGSDSYGFVPPELGDKARGRRPWKRFARKPHIGESWT